MSRMVCLIPYRDREENLKVLLDELPKWLPKGTDICIAEQTPDGPWNKGGLINAAVRHLEEYDVILQHDVDLIPFRVNYEPRYYPTHFAMFCSLFDYERRHGHMGGVSMYGRKEFIEINGYSNQFEGWGGEDHDFYQRVLFAGMTPRDGHGFYDHLDHAADRTQSEANLARSYAHVDPRTEGYAQNKGEVLEDSVDDDIRRLIIEVPHHD